MKTIDFRDLTAQCLAKTAELTRRYSSRLAGSDACTQAARALFEEWKIQ